jgi:hypothetical protein
LGLERKNAAFEVLMTVKIPIDIFWVITSQSSGLKMEVAEFSEMLVSHRNSPWHHNLDHRDL